MKTTVSTKGQLILPTEIRRRDLNDPGQEFDVERIDRGEYRLVRRQPPPNEGLIDWLMACPEKGYFVPIESESTDRVAGIGFRRRLGTAARADQHVHSDGTS